MKSKKIALAVLALSILVQVFCAPLSAFAAVTWQEEDGTWRCFEKDGTLVTDQWVRGGGVGNGSYYYLDENGRMAEDTLVEYNGNYYYVDGDGARVTNRWVCFPNEFDLWEEDVEHIWYYFGAGGKAVRDGKKTIDEKKYLFDNEGRMLSGWQRWGEDDSLYYLGTCDEGWIHTGWQSLEPWIEMDGDYELEEWYYFRPVSGKAYQDVKKRIDGDYYVFDENGVTKDRWYYDDSDVGVASGSEAEPAWYSEDTGKAWKGWIHAYAPEDVDETGDLYWYYLDSKGIPFNYGGRDSGSGRQKAFIMEDGGRSWWERQEGMFAAKVIGGKTYLFNDKGQMMTGYWYLGNVPRAGGPRLGSESAMSAYYFCNQETKKEGQMLTGRQTMYDDGGDAIAHLYLKKDGNAYRNIIVDGRFYGPDGKRVDADDDYRVLSISAGTKIRIKGSSRVLDHGCILVDENGRVKKSGTATVDGVRYSVHNYVATELEESD